MSQRPVNVTEGQLAELLQPVILGADYSAYASVRGFWEAYGVRSLIYGSSDVKSVSRTRFADYHVVDGLDRAEVLLPLLRDLGERLCAEGKVAFLAPCGDFYARIVSEHKAELEQWFYTPVVDFDVLDFVTQKENFYRICDELGICYPKTRYLDCSDPNGVADDEGFQYPLVAKPSNSAEYHYAEFPGKKKIFIVRTPEELRTIYGHLKGTCYNESLIIQEFVPGNDSAMYGCYAYADEDSNLVFALTTHLGLEDHHPDAIGNPVATVPEENEVVRESVARFFKRVGYRGMGCFDIKFDERDGSFRFFEINARPARSSVVLLYANINYLKIQVEDVVLGKRPRPVEPTLDWAFVGAPKSVIKRCMLPSALKDRILGCYDNGTARFALDWPDDSLSQRFWAAVNYYHQIRKFKRYLPDGDRPVVGNAS